MLIISWQHAEYKGFIYHGSKIQYIKNEEIEAFANVCEVTRYWHFKMLSHQEIASSSKKQPITNRFSSIKPAIVIKIKSEF